MLWLLIDQLIQIHMLTDTFAWGGFADQMDMIQVTQRCC